MCTVNVCETFVSIQGESTYAGLPCFFVRLAGCNLRCIYCDTKYAWKPGRDVSIPEIVRRCEKSGASIAEITGGEPLLQSNFPYLAKALRDKSGMKVLVETNGSCDISEIPRDVVAVMDVKCPGSGEGGSVELANLKKLRPYDEVKFVLVSRADYIWAAAFERKHCLHKRCNAVLFSPVSGRLDDGKLGKWIISDGLPVRLQVQLHKMAGMK